MNKAIKKASSVRGVDRPHSPERKMGNALRKVRKLMRLRRLMRFQWMLRKIWGAGQQWKRLEMRPGLDKEIP